MRCCDCKEEKDSSLFPPSQRKNTFGICKPCGSSRAKDWAARNPDKKKIKDKRFYLKHRDRLQIDKIKKRERCLKGYGLTLEQFELLLRIQGSKCAACGRSASSDKRKFAVDHCHRTNVIRGIICHKCNSGIGSLGDSVEGVRSALNYLERALQQPTGLVMPKRKSTAKVRINLFQR